MLAYAYFGKRGSVDPILNSYVQGSSYPYATLGALTSQMIMLRSRFASYEQYAEATWRTSLPREARN